jgi:hypothetical protein
MPGQRWPMVGSLVSLVLLLVIAGAGTFEAAPAPGAFTVAILRRDGMLVPFANFDGKRWRNPWPAPGKPESMPITTAEIPKGWWPDKQPLIDWKLIPIGAKNPTMPASVRVTGINWFLAACQPGVGLRTDYKPAILPPPPRVHPYPKDALAVSGDIRIDPIELVEPTDKVPQSLTALLPDAVGSPEEKAVEALSVRGWTHSYTKPEREKTPVHLEALYRVRQMLDGRDLYYFEAVKRYFLPKEPAIAPKASIPHAGEKPDQTCDLITFTWGWFTTTPEGRILNLMPKVLITSCDYKNARFMLPLGTVTIDNERLWIVQWSNPTSESYMVIDPKAMLEERPRLEPRLVVNGGSCEAPEN